MCKPRSARPHLQDQLLDLARRPRATGLAAPAAIVFFGDQPAIPPEQGVRRYQGADFKETFSADRLGLRCKKATLTIGEQQAFPTQLLAEYSVFLLQDAECSWGRR